MDDGMRYDKFIDWLDHGDGDLFQMYDEFAYFVSRGSECTIYVNGKGYWISNNKDGYYVNPEFWEPENQNDPSIYQEFATGEDMIRDARIDGRSLKELWYEGKLEIDFFT